jgi:hypothetical protein
MFCTDCKVTFNWRTMQIHGQGNSNPHYLEWKATQPQLPQEVACLSVVERFTRFFEKVDGYSPERRKVLTKYYQIPHLDQITLSEERQNINENGFLKFRVKFLRNLINEWEWKRQIQRLDKSNRLLKF